MADLAAVYDACVLYPAPLRDLLMHLAISNLFRAKWTDAIHEEWIRSVLKDRPDLTLDQLQRTRTLMNSHVQDCLVKNYEALIPTLNLPDPHDRHVLAAAIHSGADVIVTYNVKDFPSDAILKFGIEAQHPDDFIRNWIDDNSLIVCAAARLQRQNLKNPPKTIDEFLDVLERQRLPQTVAALRQFSDLL